MKYDSFVITDHDREQLSSLRKVMNHSPMLAEKLARVIGESHNAVRGYVLGLRDGSPCTLEKCRELGIAISSLIYYRTTESKVHIEEAEAKLAEVEEKWRDKGHSLPYDDIPPDPPSAVDVFARAVENSILAKLGNRKNG
jgi:transcriptional regulator with XRE-family HTH domain